MDKYQESFQTWNKVAKAYEDMFMSLDLYNDSYDAFLELLCKSSTSVLEIGCGPGNITKYLLSKNPNLHMKGIDISEKMIELARQNNPTAEFKVMDSRKIDSIHEKYDAIICGFCIPYLSKKDCSKLINDCEHLLHNSGILYLSFVEGDDNNSGFISGSSGARAYFYYHELKTIKQELKLNHLVIVDILDKKYKKSDTISETHTIIIAKKTT